MRTSIVILSMTLIFLASCKNDYDARNAAKEYCKCMKENRATKEYLYASKVCDGELIKRNRYYKLFMIDLQYSRLYDKLPKSTIDSTKNFHLIFLGETQKQCCYEILYCDKDTINK